MFTESGTREQKSPKDIIAEVDAYMRQQTASGADEFKEDDNGSIAGLVLDVKPASFFGGIKNSKALKELLERNGVAVKLINDIIYKPELVAKRVADERALAEECGWNFSESVDQNVARAKGIYNTSPEEQALMGFILGYPASALRDFKKSRIWDQQGIPRVGTVFHSAVLGGDFAGVSVDQFRDYDKETLKELKIRLEAIFAEVNKIDNRTARSARTNRLYSVLIKEFKPHIRQIYAHYGPESILTEQKIDEIIDSYTREVAIESPQGYQVYNFVVHSDEALNAPDITELRKKVSAAFKDI